MEPLTPRQEEILEMIRHSIQQSGMPPTRVEIAQAFGFRSPNAAEGHLRALARKGAIELLPGASRGIVLVDDYEASGLPVIPQHRATPPLLADDNIEAYYDLNPYLFEPVADLLVSISGTDLQGAGILKGDLVAIAQTGQARSGQIVAAWLNDALIVRRLKRNRKRETLLQAEGRARDIRVNDGDRFELIGIGVGLIRNDKPL